MLRKLVPLMTLAAALFAPLAASAADFYVRNDSNSSVAYLLVSPSWSGAFIPARDETLGVSQYIHPGQLWDIHRNGNDCVYDLRAIFTDGSRTTRYNVDLCDSPTWTLY